MFAFSLCGVAASDQSAMRLSGGLSASSTSGTVTSATVTVTVPPGNSGVFTFENYIDNGTIGTTQYSRNGGAFTGITDGSDTVAFADGDTLAVRTNSVGIGEDRTFTVRDKTTQMIVATALHNYA